MNQRLFFLFFLITSFDLSGILYRIYVPIVHREIFRIKKRKKMKEKNKKCKVMIDVEYIN